MAVAVHRGGPADGVKVEGVVGVAQTRFYAPASLRRKTRSRFWVQLARYVFVPPTDGKTLNYQYTGIEEKPTPQPATVLAYPDWSTL